MFHQKLNPFQSSRVRTFVVAAFVSSVCVVWVNRVPLPANATTGCTSGSVSTTSFSGQLFAQNWEDNYFNLLLQPDSLPHNFTRVTFSSDGQNRAQCTWVAPMGTKGGKLLVVGGGGGGGNILGGGGGGGGVYSSRLTTFVGGTTYDISVGVGGISPPSNCANSCNGGNGEPSSLSRGGKTIASASGGGGGGGKAAPAISVDCTGHDACGAGGGGSAPNVGSDIGTSVASGGGSWASSNSGLAFPGNGGQGAPGSRVTACEYAAGGGGGAMSNAAPAVGDQRIRAMGASGRPLPIDKGAERYLYGAGGGGSITDYCYGGFSDFGGSSLNWGSYHEAANQSAGGRGGFLARTATAGVNGFGGGGGGGGPSRFVQRDFDNVNGAAGGSGTVSIFYLEKPKVSAGQALVNHSYGASTSTVAFSATGGNRELAYGTSPSVPTTYTWSVGDASGQPITGVSIASNGVVTVGPSTLLGTTAAVVKATDGAGVFGTVDINIVTTRGSQQPLVFTSDAPVDHHVGGSPYYVGFSGGSGSAAANVTVDQVSASICSISSTIDGDAVSFHSVGECTLNLNRPGDSNYFDAQQVQQTITVTPRSAQSALSITGMPTTAINLGETITVGASGGSGTSPYVFSIPSFSSSVCSVQGRVITTLALGNCVVAVNRDGDYNFSEAVEESSSFRVVAGRTIALSQPTSRVFQYGGDPVITTVGATVSAGVPFTVAFTVVAGSSNCSFGHPGRYDLAFTGTGICTIVVEENDNTYSYTRSSEERFYVVATGDVTAPTVAAVSAPNFSGRLLAGNTVDIAVRFSERVIATGSPQLQLETGTTDRFATYLSGAYSDTLIFRYVVQSGDTSDYLDYLASNSLQVNPGTIADLSSNSANLTLPQPGSANSLRGTTQIAVGVATTTTTSTTSTTSTTTTTTAAPAITLSQPSAVMVVSKVDGFQFVIDGYDPLLDYTCVPAAGKTFEWFEQELGIGRVLGMQPGETSSISVTASANGASSSPGTVTGASLSASLTPTFGTVQRTTGGFTAVITNFDDRYTYLVTSGLGTVDTEAETLVVTGLASEQSGSATIQAARAGHATGTASVTGRSLEFQTTTTSTLPGTTTTSPGTSLINSDTPLPVSTTTTTTTTITITTTIVQPNSNIQKSVASLLRIRLGKSMKLRTLAVVAGMKVSTGAKISARVSVKTLQQCAISKSTIKAKKKGKCSVSISVKPKRGKTVRKSVSLVVF